MGVQSVGEHAAKNEDGSGQEHLRRRFASTPGWLLSFVFGGVPGTLFVAFGVPPNWEAAVGGVGLGFLLVSVPVVILLAQDAKTTELNDTRRGLILGCSLMILVGVPATTVWLTTRPLLLGISFVATYVGLALLAIDFDRRVREPAPPRMKLEPLTVAATAFLLVAVVCTPAGALNDRPERGDRPTSTTTTASATTTSSTTTSTTTTSTTTASTTTVLSAAAGQGTGCPVVFKEREESEDSQEARRDRIAFAASVQGSDESWGCLKEPMEYGRYKVFDYEKAQPSDTPARAHLIESDLGAGVLSDAELSHLLPDGVSAHALDSIGGQVRDRIFCDGDRMSLQPVSGPDHVHRLLVRRLRDGAPLFEIDPALLPEWLRWAESNPGSILVPRSDAETEGDQVEQRLVAVSEGVNGEEVTLKAQTPASSEILLRDLLELPQCTGLGEDADLPRAYQTP